MSIDVVITVTGLIRLTPNSILVTPHISHVHVHWGDGGGMTTLVDVYTEETVISAHAASPHIKKISLSNYYA